MTDFTKLTPGPDNGCPECFKLWRSFGEPKDITQHLYEHIGKSKHQFAFTFTTNLDTKLEIQKEMCESAYRLFSQKSNSVNFGEVYLEYTEAERPHLHGWYQTDDGGRIFAKTFKRCWRYWGEKERKTQFPGGYHELMKSNRYKEYSSSEDRIILRKNGDKIEYFEENVNTWWPEKKA